MGKYLHREGDRSYQALVQAWKSLRATHGLHVREVACVGAGRTLLLAESGSSTAPVVHVTAGVHGDEPVSPWSLLSLVRDGLLNPRLAFRMWPCTNPTGYELGTRRNAEGKDINRSFSRGGTTPEARAIVTANRDRRFVLSIDLHEDYEADGFYCYEPVVDGATPLSAAIVRAIEWAGFPIQSLEQGFDLGYPSDPEAADRLRSLDHGRVLVNAPAEIAHFRGLPLSLFMLRRAAKRYVTVETPRCRSWDDRVAMHRIAVVTATAEAIALAEKEQRSCPNAIHSK